MAYSATRAFPIPATADFSPDRDILNAMTNAKITLKAIAACCTAVILSACPFSLPPAVGTAESFTVRAAHGTDYLVRTWIPPDPGAELDALYVLDGDEAFGGTANILAANPRSGTSRSTMLVAIGYGSGPNERTRDYTPTVSDGEGGGADAFRAFLADTLFPEIERRYPVVKSRDGRIFAGHSFGGLAVLDCLCVRPELFSRYASSSPSCWWGGNAIFERVDAALADPSIPKSAIHLTMGSHEGGGMNALFSELERRLASAPPGPISSKARVLEGKRHFETRNLSYETALGWFREVSR